MKKTALFRCVLIPVLIGILAASAFAYSLFCSEQRDWGKTYETYDQFVAVYINLGVQWSMAAALILSMLSSLFCWFLNKIKARQTLDRSDS